METEPSREEESQYFKCHVKRDLHQQHGMEKMLVKTSDNMVVPNGTMEKGKKQTIMEESMSLSVRLKSEEKQIEQQEERHEKRHKEDNTNDIDLWEENVEAGEWKVDGRKKEHHKLVVKEEEENPIREEDQEGHEGFSVELREKDGEENGDDRHVQEDHESFSVEPRKHEDVGIQDVFEIIQVEMKEKGGEKDAKDGKECLFGEEEIREHDFKGGENCLIGDPEVWMEDQNAVYLFNEETRHSTEENIERESQGARKDEPKKRELENKHVPKIVREAVSRFKQKAHE